MPFTQINNSKKLTFKTSAADKHRTHVVPLTCHQPCLILHYSCRFNRDVKPKKQRNRWTNQCKRVSHQQKYKPIQPFIMVFKRYTLVLFFSLCDVYIFEILTHVIHVCGFQQNTKASTQLCTGFTSELTLPLMVHAAGVYTPDTFWTPCTCSGDATRSCVLVHPCATMYDAAAPAAAPVAYSMGCMRRPLLTINDCAIVYPAGNITTMHHGSHLTVLYH